MEHNVMYNLLYIPQWVVMLFHYVCIFTWINKTIFLFIQISMQYSTFLTCITKKVKQQLVNNCGAGVHLFLTKKLVKWKLDIRAW